MNAIYFYDPNNEFGWLANFSSHSFILDGKQWPSVEHYFQASKFNEEERAERIRTCRTAAEAKGLGWKMKKYKRANWYTIRVDIMRRAINAKFRQNPTLANLLESTSPATLFESAVDDDFWGTGPDGQGKNMMGVLLMELRGKLNREHNFHKADGGNHNEYIYI